MDAPTQLDALLAVLERCDVAVRREHLGGDGGGLIRLKGRPVVFVDLDADWATRVARCVEAVAGLPEVEFVHLPPVLRERIELARGEA